MNGALFNFIGNMAGITTPIIIGYLVEKTGSFNDVLIFVSLTALCAIVSYGPIVGEIKRLDLTIALLKAVGMRESIGRGMKNTSRVLFSSSHFNRTRRSGLMPSGQEISRVTRSSKHSQVFSARLGCGADSAVRSVAEIIAGAGFDWIVIDGEHAPNDIPSLLAQLQAMRGGTAEPVFRVPWNDPVIIKRALDVGARSLLVPFVQNAEEARKAVAAARYPPLGIRGVAVGPRANDYGRIQGYHANAHLDTCVLVQLESKAALKEIEAIAAVEGVDGLFIGPSDLAADFGQLGNPSHPEVQAAIKDAAERIRAAGKSAGTLSGNVDAVERLISLGFNFTAVGSDVGLLARAAESVAARFRSR